MYLLSIIVFKLISFNKNLFQDESDEEWLTPRIQVYFQIYTKNPKGVEQQNNHCYNCGARIESGILFFLIFLFLISLS